LETKSQVKVDIVAPNRPNLIILFSPSISTLLWYKP